MNVIACFLAALLALQGPTAATSGAPSCDVTDNRCKAERFQRQAAQASSPSQRALYFHAAYRSYMGLFKETGEVRDLCEARRTFEQSLAVEGLSETQRASFEEGRAELESRERKISARCGSSAKRRARAAAPVVAEKPAPTASPRATASIDVKPAEAALLQDERTDLLPVSAGRKASPRLPAGAAARPADEPLSVSPANTPAPPRSGRPLVIAGGVTLGIGLSLAGVAGYAGGRALEAHRAGVELHEAVQGPPDDADRAKDAALEREYRTMGPVAIGTAVAGGVAVIVGAVLVGVGGRRLARVASSTAFVPVPGGLAFHARF